MVVNKISASNKMPEAKKKSILQQVMTPKDWVAMGVLVVFSAVCWLWVVNVYEQTITIDDLVGSQATSQSIDTNGIL